MKKASYIAMILAATLVALVGCASPTNSSSGGGTTTVAFKSLDAAATLSVLPGTTGQIKVNFTPTNATDKGVTYSIATNTQSITVSSTGLVTVPAAAKLGTKVVVTVTHTTSKKVTKVTVIAEKPLPASKAAPVVAAAPAPATQTVAGKTVPKSAKIGSKSIGKASQVNIFNASQVRKFTALTANKPTTSLYYGLQDGYFPLLDMLTDQSAGIIVVGLAPLAKLTTYDPSSAAADTQQNVTFSMTQAEIDAVPASMKAAGQMPPDVNNLKDLTTAYVFDLKNWQWHTLESGDFFDLGYTNEIYFELGGNSFYIDYNDDATSVLTEMGIAASASSSAMTLVATTDFNNATTGFEATSGSTNVKFDLTYIGDAANTVFGSLSLDAWDDTTNTGGTASFAAVYDDNGAFSVGYLSAGADLGLTPVIVFEELDASGAQKYFGNIAIDETTGTVTPTTSVGTAPTSWATDKYYSYFF